MNKLLVISLIARLGTVMDVGFLLGFFGLGLRDNGERPQAQRLRSAARWLRQGGGGRMGAGGGMVRSSQRDARSSSLQRMVRRCG